MENPSVTQVCEWQYYRISILFYTYILYCD
jgi:hypothetical protein